MDPIFHDRNASANLEQRKFEKFKKCARAFLSNPAEKFFVEKKVDLEVLKKKGAIILTSSPKDGEKDVIGSKLLKAYTFIKKGLKDHGVVDSGWEWKYGEDATMWYFLERKELEPTFEQEGPPLNYKPFVKAFKEKHRKTFERDKKIWAKITRECTAADTCLKTLLRNPYVKERMKKIKVVAS